MKQPIYYSCSNLLLPFTTLTLPGSFQRFQLVVTCSSVNLTGLKPTHQHLALLSKTIFLMIHSYQISNDNMIDQNGSSWGATKDCLVLELEVSYKMVTDQMALDVMKETQPLSCTVTSVSEIHLA